MTPHRDPLAAALARATAAEAALARATAGAATPARQGWRSPVVRWLAPVNAWGSVVWAVAIAREGWTAQNTAGALMNIAAWAAWALAFVRRVPVDGGGR